MVTCCTCIFFNLCFRIMWIYRDYEFGRRSCPEFSISTLSKNQIYIWNKKCCHLLVCIKAKILPYRCCRPIAMKLFKLATLLLVDWCMNWFYWPITEVQSLYRSDKLGTILEHRVSKMGLKKVAKKEFNLLHTYVLNEFLTADHSWATK